jgi:hypothetical protein
LYNLTNRPLPLSVHPDGELPALGFIDLRTETVETDREIRKYMRKNTYLKALPIEQIAKEPEQPSTSPTSPPPSAAPTEEEGNEANASDEGSDATEAESGDSGSAGGNTSKSTRSKKKTARAKN